MIETRQLLEQLDLVGYKDSDRKKLCAYKPHITCNNYYLSDDTIFEWIGSNNGAIMTVHRD